MVTSFQALFKHLFDDSKFDSVVNSWQQIIKAETRMKSKSVDKLEIDRIINPTFLSIASSSPSDSENNES